MPNDGLTKYADMQRRIYNEIGKASPEEIVGNYPYHENFPYETQLLFKYGDLRKPLFEDFNARRALDVGCGEGRMIRRLKSMFGQIDGADISSEMIEHARRRTPGSQFWVTNGHDVGAAPLRAYDFAYCTISLQHVCVFSIRDSIIKSVKQVLKPDGKMTLQMLYSQRYPLLPVGRPVHLRDDDFVQFWRRDHQHALWEQDKTDATTTNSGCDVIVGPGELKLVKSYFEKHFHEVEFWFYDISVDREEPRVLTGLHPNSHLWEQYHGTHFIFIHCARPLD